ncbi:apoptosis-stimulating of p53 protein 1 [Anabrus simplex]|uniref:apoptosis-stimulating of p53 protein 1 n=1 Tax=Anabrus simplex TaxID=316456 RepID=UPI0035A2917D
MDDNQLRKRIEAFEMWCYRRMLKLPDGVELTLGELQQMACRQQQQIDSQQQLLVAKEQRLRFLKQQEARHHQVAAENERLRRLRDRVEAQELKLRKLRALRGQVDQNKLNNASLTSDLDSIRALFNEKEKELSLAVAKVEELTRQLEELKRGRGANRDQTTQPSPAALELDKLRRELMYRNKLNEQQNARICQQREALTQRQEEMSNIDKRISELQDRLHRKRLLNQQLANQITAASNKANAQQQLRSAASATTGQQHPSYGGQGPTGKPKPRSGNIAAVEPYHHVPLPTNSDLDKQAQRTYGGQKPGSGSTNQPRNDGYLPDHKHQILQQDRVGSTQDDFHTKLAGNQGNNHNSNATTKTKDKEDMYLPEFGGSKSDPKYQTLPYNTKFTVNFMSAGNKAGSEKKADTIEDARRNNDNSEMAKNNINNINNLNNNIINPNQQQQQQQQHLMTVHSIPIPALSGVSKGLATGLSNQNQGDQQTGYQQHTGNNKVPPNSAASHMLGHLGPRPFGLSHPTYTNPALQPGLTRGQPVGGSSSTTSSTSSLATNSSSASSSSNHQKPVSSVAPTSVQHQKPSPIYQTSSTKIHPVQPQTLSSTPQGILRDLRGELSPPQGTSTPLGTPETSQSDSRTKPALPPKPALPVKPTPPPRQTQHFASVEIPSDAVDCALHVLRGSNTRGITQPEHLHSKQSHVPSMLDPDDLPPVPPCPPPPPPTTEPPHDDLPGSTNGSSSSMGQRRTPGNGATSTSTGSTSDPLPIIKARPLTIKKQPASEHPKLKTVNFNNGSSSSGNSTNGNVHVSINRRIEMPPAFLFPETEAPPADLISSSSSSEPGLPTSEEVSTDLTGEGDSDENNRLHKPEEMKTDVNAAVVDVLNSININQEQQQQQQQQHSDDAGSQHIVRRTKKGNLKSSGGKAVGPGSRRVSFDPLALLLDASLEGELELVRKTAGQVTNPSAANDEGITALHNAICAGHLDIVKFLVEFGCDVNAQDSDGWTPLHCAASCNNLAMVRFLVEHGACIFATTLSDHETAAEKCEEDEEGFDGCSEYLYSVQEKLGILNNGIVYAVYDYEAHNSDELSFKEGDKLVVLRKGDEWEREWWWSRLNDQEGYVPRNLLGLYPRVQPGKKVE